MQAQTHSMGQSLIIERAAKLTFRLSMCLKMWCKICFKKKLKLFLLKMKKKNIFSDRFDVLMSKIIFKNKKLLLDAFLNEK